MISQQTPVFLLKMLDNLITDAIDVVSAYLVVCSVQVYSTVRLIGIEK
jgi:hypothetical protein